MRDTDWQYGGSGDLFRDLTWSNRPDMTNSEAPRGLQDAWVATILALRDVMGPVRSGSCFFINLAAAPLVENVLGERAHACAGYAGFIGQKTRFECGFRWAPKKWSDWIDAGAGAHLSPQQDLHTWVETSTHLVDFSTGDAMGDPDDSWPPLVYRPKWNLPKHPREAKGAGSILLWRNPKALEALAHLAPIVAPLAARALEIYGASSIRTTPTDSP